MQQVTIRNVTRGTMVAAQGEVARTFAERGRGLLGRSSIPSGYGLVIYPEWSIHMLGMRFAIDVLFVGKDDRVVGVREGLPPWHPYAGVAPWRGRYVVELPTGTIRSSETKIGDQLGMVPPLEGVTRLLGC